MDDTVTLWLERLKLGDDQAIERLWQRYFVRVMALAKARLGGAARKVADEEDVALSVFDSFCRGMSAGKYPHLDDRESLWPLLVVMTVRKACDCVNAERRQKRGDGRVHAEAEIGAAGDDAFRLDAVLAQEPSPDLLASMNEECERLFDLLDDDQRRIALGKLEGYTNQELAAQHDCGLRTIERRLDLIRRVWEQALGETP